MIDIYCSFCFRDSYDFGNRYIQSDKSISDVDDDKNTGGGGGAIEFSHLCFFFLFYYSTSFIY